MNIGALITRGPQDWQIIQQVEGVADIKIQGTYETNEEIAYARVFGRVVFEDSYESVIRWQEAVHTKEKEWELTFKDVPKGGLYRIETCLKTYEGQAVEWSSRGDMIHHIGVGDVYVIAGQSNSAGYGKDAVLDSPELGIHLLKNSGKWDLATHPFNESTHVKYTANREGGNPGHSPWLSFAKHLKKELGYPIGLVQAALGGSPLSAWNPEEDGYLYRNMLEIIQNHTKGISGVLWYQGCTDADQGQEEEAYLERFKVMVHTLRQDVGHPNLPIFTVQLNKVINYFTADQAQIERADAAWAGIREAQRKAAHQIEQVYIIPSIDLPLSDAIHNNSYGNLVIGERVARCALSHVYHRNRVCDAPDIQEALRIDEQNVKLSFNHVYERLDVFDVSVDALGFTVTDELGQVEIVGYGIDQNSIFLKLGRNLQGVGKVSCRVGRSLKGYLPRDIEGQLPILVFHNIDIK
ncbi:MAG: sialate O-acetylesterase [Niameybacter sp.]